MLKCQENEHEVEANVIDMMPQFESVLMEVSH